MNKNKWSKAILFLIIFISLQHIWFFILDDIPVIDHEYYHSGHIAVESYYELQGGKWLDWAKGMFIYNGTRQPQLIGRLMGLACYIFGLNRFVMREINLIFYILLIVSTYCLGKELQNQKLGFWAAFFTASLPLIISHSRRGDLHFFTTSLFITSILMLIKSANFKRTKFSLLFGVIFGLMLLTHETALLYLVIVSLSLFITTFLSGNYVQKKNFILSYSIILIFFIPFYIPAFVYSNGDKALRLYPWFPNFTPYHSIYYAFKYFLEELKQDLGGLNFYAAIISYGSIFFLIKRKNNLLKNNFYLILSIIFTIIPFLIITIGSLFFREFDTLQYMMPSYPLICLLTVYIFTKIKFNLGILLLLFANIWLWVFMIAFMFSDTFKLQSKIRYPEPLNWGDDTLTSSMFYPKKPLLEAKEVRNYFKKIFENKKAIVYCLRIPERNIVNRSYFDELLMYGIIQPGKPGFKSNPCYTDRNDKENCKRKIYLIFIYKDIKDSILLNFDKTKIFLDPADYSFIKKIMQSYNCKVIKEFYNPFSRKKIITVIEGDLR